MKEQGDKCRDCETDAEKKQRIKLADNETRQQFSNLNSGDTG